MAATWSSVAGTQVPSDKKKVVMPLLKAIRPTRRELGVHSAGKVEATDSDAAAETVSWEAMGSIGSTTGPGAMLSMLSVATAEEEAVGAGVDGGAELEKLRRRRLSEKLVRDEEGTGASAVSLASDRPSVMLARAEVAASHCRAWVVAVPVARLSPALTGRAKADMIVERRVPGLLDVSADQGENR